MIVLFGGTFNPPHIAHKIIAEVAYDELKPSRFLIIPASVPPHKTNNFIVDFNIRYNWLKKVFSSKFEISNIENKLPKPSYSFQTIEYFSKKDKVILLIGEDSLLNFKKWYKWEEILKKCTLAVYPRFFKNKINTDIPYIKINSPLIDISSTTIRNRITQKKTINGMVEDKIKDEIIKVYTYFTQI
ncbi:putative nicotinate-nucleotide adenylyltransferase [Tepiditoga spiralis]|uniref:Probable nicotinate-nucleotide adenylyltransferase n=1 Tax=Tepiditoga spiralis TaxID=2108365 RepID=A0A7G1G6Q5_9BACT|nr:nicotinate (nicotinamide) nucleotide adenylyltransferase [Tepiditoga spiralis]BBE31865.1 putative nicotinate-nucleotide adenylyltransferase [Tepiditoga spiralis]